ncbi:hypothetical protein [Herbaspirillum sp.]|nr:hypothetical protein [Herbaspirillum sp.]
MQAAKGAARRILPCELPAEHSKKHGHAMENDAIIANWHEISF